tara:strand:+ start:5118 stop:5969 length:852 start_codon:yes stop_codon:yes gene_type:complete
LINKRIFVNTVPHSGTHFLTALLERVGYKHSVYKNTYYMEKPFFRRNQKAGINWRTATLLQEKLKISSKKDINVSVSAPVKITSSTYKSLFKVLKKGNFIIGHVPYSKEADLIHQGMLDCTLSIIRDPRDMILSMMRHVKEREVHHAHKYLFKVLTNDRDRFFAIAEGYNNQYGNLIGVDAMINSILDWEKTTNSLCLRFEEVIGPKGGGSEEIQLKVLNNLFSFLEVDISKRKIKKIAEESFGKASTFRKGGINGWKDSISLEDNNLFEQKYSSILERTSYK